MAAVVVELRLVGAPGDVDAALVALAAVAVAAPVNAPGVPSAMTTSLLQSGQPIANTGSRTPPVVVPAATGWAGVRT